MNLIERVQSSFYDSIEVKNNAAKALLPIIVGAGQILAQCLKNGHKILSCGNGGSACDAQHFTTEMVNRFMIERDGLPAVSLTADMAVLTAIANDYGYQNVFAKQVKALGRVGDILLAISTSGNSQSIVQAISMAHEHQMQVIALTGSDGGLMAKLLDKSDIEIRVPSKITPRIQETHILIIHCLCDLVDRILFSDKFEEKA
ncbi:MAG TPA: phosphoheptose isomerase [Coxiellaceae bacterium]|nr:phosphoheptose isomerase [Coxiellaceae bacterium]HBY55453.1 phosphoheptose isomerase [Coxiellaceae bacterium]